MLLSTDFEKFLKIIFRLYLEIIMISMFSWLHFILLVLAFITILLYFPSLDKYWFIIPQILFMEIVDSYLYLKNSWKQPWFGDLFCATGKRNFDYFQFHYPQNAKASLIIIIIRRKIFIAMPRDDSFLVSKHNSSPSINRWSSVKFFSKTLVWMHLNSIPNFNRPPNWTTDRQSYFI